MNALWIIVLVLLVLAVVGIPSVGVWPHTYGYYPSGLLTLIIIILIVLMLTGKL